MHLKTPQDREIVTGYHNYPYQHMSSHIPQSFTVYCRVSASVYHELARLVKIRGLFFKPYVVGSKHHPHVFTEYVIDVCHMSVLEYY